MKATALLLLLLIFSMIGHSQTTDLFPAKILESKSYAEIAGTPRLVDSPYGQAVYFDGMEDGLFVDSMPLAGLSQFTVEAIFRPDRDGNFEQRFLHFGEPNEARLLFEIRTTETEWYFDAYINTSKGQKALIDPEQLHPLDQWHHVAFVVDDGQLVTYVNGKKELEERINMDPLQTGQMAIGVRQNKVSWFKGAICQIRISSEALSANDFLTE
jgi:hypothetical protein